MKKLLIFHLTFLFSFFLAHSQNITNPNPGNFGTQEQRNWIDSALYIPTFSTVPHDTLDLHSQGVNGKGMKSVAAALYFDKVGHILYVWDPTLKTWIAAGAPGVYFGDETTIHLTTATSVFSIAANYHGQSSITTVGTITGGVWNSTPITDAYISSSAIWNAKLSGALPSGDIFVGNSLGIATAAAMSGDATLNNTGILTLASIITAGSCTSCNLTYDSKGRITIAGNGTGGGGGAAPFYDSGAIIKNFADATRKIILNASLITTGTTRTLYSPNTSGILAVVDGINGRMTYKAADGKIYTMPVIYDSANATPGMSVQTNLILSTSITSIIPLDTANNKLLVMNSSTGLVRRMSWQQVVGILGVDTLFVDEPGVGPGAIQLAYTHGGHLIIPKWAPGTGISFSIGPDSLVTINSTGGGSGGTEGIDDVLAIGQQLTLDRTMDIFDHIYNVTSTAAGEVNMTVAPDALGSKIFFQMFGSANVGLLKGQNAAGTQFGVIAVDPTGVAFGQTEGNYTMTFLQVVSDSTAFKPIVVDAAGHLRQMSSWQVTGGGGGGSPQTWQQTLTTGSTLTGNNSIDEGSGNIQFTSSGAPGGTMDIINTGGGYGLQVQNAVPGGLGVLSSVLNGTSFYGTATTGTAFLANVTTGNAIQTDADDGASGIMILHPSSNNTIRKTLFLENFPSAGPAAAGTGLSVVFDLGDASGQVTTANEVQAVMLSASSASTRISALNFLVNANSNGTEVLGLQVLGLASGAATYSTPLIPVFTSNALAISGGLTAGMHYRNGDADNIVH